MDPETSDSNRSVIKQAGIEETSIKLMNYYDIMILGLTGQGKSTTADKLLIANPTGCNYRQDPPIEYPELTPVGQQMNMEDLSMWHSDGELDSVERLSTRLKNLVFFRKLDDPHSHVNGYRAAGMLVCMKTLGCELLSNETSRMRILDVPGFFGEVSAEQLQACSVPGAPSLMLAQNATSSHLGIMRNILHIQAMMSMKFRRILYFLPCRGRLERTNAALQQELQLMVHYFGRSIFETMVIVATLPDVVYDTMPAGFDVKFPTAKLEDTRRCFQEALRSFLNDDVPSPPVIFVSLTESCESILEKVKATDVTRDGLQLQLSPSVCARCSMKIGSLNGDRVAGTFGRDWSQSILYNHSLCHPILVPKYTQLQKFKEGVAYAVKTILNRDEWNWPDFSVEICPSCKQPSGAQGCMKIDQEYSLKEGAPPIIVDHTNQFQEPFEHHRYLLQDGNTFEGDGGSESSADSDGGNGFEGGDVEDEQTDNGCVVDHGHLERSGHVEHVQVVVEIEPQNSPEASVTNVATTSRPDANVRIEITPQEPPPAEIEQLASSVEGLKDT